MQKPISTRKHKWHLQAVLPVHSTRGILEIMSLSFIFVVLGFELMASHLLGRYSNCLSHSASQK
jgi:hypothetical protein